MEGRGGGGVEGGEVEGGEGVRVKDMVRVGEEMIWLWRFDVMSYENVWM